MLPPQVSRSATPVYYRGGEIDRSTTWTTFRSQLIEGAPLQLVTPFQSSDSDENFNSRTDRFVTPADFGGWRYSPVYAFLTADGVGERGSEHARLLRAAKPRFWAEKVTRYKDIESGWNADDLKRIQRGELASQTYVHLFYASVLCGELRARGNSVVEIGGGYGGLARCLAAVEPGFWRTYTIIDLPFVQALQEHVLRSEGHPVRRGRGDGDAAISLLDALQLGEGDLGERYDVAIATHSLSELDPAQINFYVDAVLARARFILLAQQLVFHGGVRGYSGYDVSWLPALIERRGYRRSWQLQTERGRVLNVLFERA